MSKHSTALSLVTSQNITAPKLDIESRCVDESLVTSQNITAPKPVLANVLIT